MIDFGSNFSVSLVDISGGIFRLKARAENPQLTNLMIENELVRRRLEHIFEPFFE